MSTKIDEDTLRGLLIVLGWTKKYPPQKDWWYRPATTEEALRLNHGDLSRVVPGHMWGNTLRDAARVEREVSGINLLGGTQDENT